MKAERPLVSFVYQSQYVQYDCETSKSSPVATLCIDSIQLASE